MITPIYQILRDGADINPIIKDKFLSLTIKDKIGPSADTLDLTLSFDGSYTIPRPGVVLEAKIGYAEEGLWEVGKFVVEETTLTGGADAADELNIRALSATLTREAAVDALQGSTERIWQSFDIDGTTFETIFNDVCKDAGLTTKIDPTLAKIQMPTTFQQKSDIEFLQSLCSWYNAFIKYHELQVIVAPIDSDKIGSLNIARTNTITRYSFTKSERTKVGSVISRYQDADAGEVVKYTAGDGKPPHIIQTTFADRTTAVHAAETILKKLQRETDYMTITMPTVAGLLAEKVLNLSDFPDPSTNGEYIVEQATHQLNSNGLSSTIKARKRG